MSDLEGVIINYELTNNLYFSLDETIKMMTISKDQGIKRKILKSSPKEFSEVLKRLSVEDANFLFDEAGLNHLSYDIFVNKKLQAIIKFHVGYLEDLLKMPAFCQLIVCNYRHLERYFNCLSSKEAILLIDYLRENYPDKIPKVMLKIDVNTQKDMLLEDDISSDLRKVMIINANKEAVDYLFKFFTRVYDLDEYSFDELFRLFSKGSLLPTDLLSHPNLVRKISTMENVKDYRLLMNALMQKNDISHFDDARKKFYTHELETYNQKEQMLARYYDCYVLICELLKNRKYDLEDLDKVLNQCLNFFGSEIGESNLRDLIIYYYRRRDKSGLKDFLQKESNLQIGNMIIDYHFEDIPHNFFLDVKQLLNYQNENGNTLNELELSLYSQLVDIDNIPVKEKLTLHQKLGEENCIIKNYDLFRRAKDSAIDLINGQILNSDSIQKFYSQAESELYGVPVYILEGQPFYAFVRATALRKYHILGTDDLQFIGDGASYSLTSSDKLNTYRDPGRYYHLIYENIPINQVVHVYPVDSFSFYERKATTAATTRVYELCTPAQLIERSDTYNEILLAQPNILCENSEVNDSLKMPKLLGLYCHDFIKSEDVMSAKNLNIGIVLIKTKAYSTHSRQVQVLPDQYLDHTNYCENIDTDEMQQRRSNEKVKIL